MADQNINIQESIKTASGSGDWMPRLQKMLSGALSVALMNSPVLDSMKDNLQEQAKTLVDSAMEPSEAVQNAVEQKRNAYSSPQEALQQFGSDSPALSDNAASTTPGNAAEGAAMNQLQKKKKAGGGNAAGGGVPGGGVGQQQQRGPQAEGVQQGQQQQQGVGGPQVQPQQQAAEGPATTAEQQEGGADGSTGEAANEPSEGANEEGAPAPQESSEAGIDGGAPAPPEGGALPSVNSVDPQTGFNQFDKEKWAAQKAQDAAPAPEVSRAPATPLDPSGLSEAEAPATEDDEASRQQELAKQQQSAKKAQKASAKKKIDFLDSDKGDSAAVRKAKDKVLWGLIADCLKPTPEVILILPYLAACLVGKFRDDHPLIIKPDFNQSWAIFGVLALYGIFVAMIFGLILILIVPFAFPLEFPDITIEAIKALGVLNFATIVTGQ